MTERKKTPSERQRAKAWLQEHASWYSFVEPGLGASVGAADAWANVRGLLMPIEFKRFEVWGHKRHGLSANQLAWWRSFNRTGHAGAVIWLGRASEWYWLPPYLAVQDAAERRLKVPYSAYSFWEMCDEQTGVFAGRQAVCR